MRIYRRDRITSPDVRAQLDELMGKSGHILSISRNREIGFEINYYLLPVSGAGTWIFLAVGYNYKNLDAKIRKIMVVGTAEEIDQLIGRRLGREGFQLATYGKQSGDMPRLLAHMLAQELER